METTKMPKTHEIMGHQIQLDKIENPHIKRSIHSRKGVLFYGDGDRHPYHDTVPGHCDYGQDRWHTDHYDDQHCDYPDGGRR